MTASEESEDLVLISEEAESVGDGSSDGPSPIKRSRRLARVSSDVLADMGTSSVEQIAIYNKIREPERYEKIASIADDWATSPEEQLAIYARVKQRVAAAEQSSNATGDVSGGGGGGGGSGGGSGGGVLPIS